MYQYQLTPALVPLEEPAAGGDGVAVVMTSAELAQGPSIPGLEGLLRHTPSPQDARVCKAEVRAGCLCGTIVTPRQTKRELPISLGYLAGPGVLVLCDDSGTVHAAVQRLRRDAPHRAYTPGTLLCQLLDQLTVKDLRHLQALEDQLAQMEDRVLSDRLEDFNAGMIPLRKEIARWVRYYSQMDDMVCELQENETGCFCQGDLALLHTVEKRLGRLRGEAQALREYGMQVRELFQSEIDIRQNRIMKILTIVTTIFLPLSLVAGWYGMNFAGMPELGWKYGYPAVIGASVAIVLICLWLMKKKKFL